MKRLFAVRVWREVFALCAIFSASLRAAETRSSLQVASPDGKLAVTFSLNAAGAPRYTIEREGRSVLRESRLGLVRDDADFTTALKLESASASERVEDRYEILSAKRRLNSYAGNRRVFHLTSGERKLDVVFQVSNDGVAFRYLFPETSATTRQIAQEETSFHFPGDARAWLQPMQVAKSGFGQSNPAYEEYYQKDIPVGTPSGLGAGWVYPALFRTGDTWVLVSEAALGRNYCGTRLRSESPDGEYSIGFPDPRENFRGGPVNPQSTLPWATPWRVIAVGSLKTIAESTLGVDLADKPAPGFIRTAEPGKAAWSWPLLGDSNTNFDVQRRFIDYAADMHWGYCLIDALWDKQIGYDKLKELVDYARAKNVKILVWYNSAGDWNTTPQTPRDRMVTRESRIAEFERLREIGVAGVKIDFFGGDGQSMIEYYHDILSDVAPYGLAMNFHGATLPRGWQRTYPNLMTVEAIRGLEYITFGQAAANEEPTHAAMLPFTRNVFDPMDFTPVVLDQIRRIQRKTTSAFELSLSVLFTSGIQHYAEIPEGMAKVPDYVRDFLRHVPSVWDDTKFLDGWPGKFVALARKGDGRWYVAGINAEAGPRKLTLDLRELGASKSGVLIADGDGGNLSFRRETVKLPDDAKFELTLPSDGGFVLVLE
jgi:alpha-glucosidase